MTTNNAVNVGLSGSTGTGNFVGANTPTLITPVIGAATGTSLDFGASATNGLIGVTGATDAASGVVGEFISSIIAASSPVTVVSATPKNITSITLTPGDWDVIGNFWIVASGGVTVSSTLGWCSLTSATKPDSSLISGIITTLGANAQSGQTTPLLRVNVSAGSTIVYLSCQTASSNNTAGSGGIYARRIR